MENVNKGANLKKKLQELKKIGDTKHTFPIEDAVNIMNEYGLSSQQASEYLQFNSATFHRWIYDHGFRYNRTSGKYEKTAEDIKLVKKTVELDSRLNAVLQLLANKEEKSQSEVIRQLLRDNIDKEYFEIIDKLNKI